MKKTGSAFSAKWIAVAIGLSFLAFNHPKTGDLVELSAWLSGRSSGFFRAIDKNRIKSLAPGTKGTIQKVKIFSKTKNYGICIDIPAERGECIWVYYNKNNPRMKLIREKSETNLQPQLTTDPTGADSAQTTDTVNGIQANPSTDVQGPDIIVMAPRKKSVETPDTTAVQTAIENVDKLNQAGTDALTPDPVCQDCAPQLSSYPGCTQINSYQEPAIAQMINSAKYSGILQGKQTEIIKTACIQRALETSANSSQFYRNCEKGDQAATRKVMRPCTSKNYVEMTSKSFNVVAQCLGEMVSGSASTKAEATLMLFSLLSLESGMNMNAVSGTGAGGYGQLIDGAITAVNQYMPNIKDFLAKSSNPQCSETLMKVLEEPMKPSKRLNCERISLHKDNPMKNLIYTFGLQALLRNYVNEEFTRATYSDVLDSQLPALEKERLLSSLAMWAHNAGNGGLIVPLRVMLTKYVANGQKISDAKDVDQFLEEMGTAFRTHPHSANNSAARRRETSTFYSSINKRMAQITSEPNSCLAQ